jgi:peptidoglycan/LPS O-acetylase OafA/YrhL
MHINNNEAAEPILHTKHVKALDGLRGYAAILVTFYHAILHLDVSAIGTVLSPAIDAVALGDIPLKIGLILLNGSTAVLLFYVLSGAVLCQSLLKEDLEFKSIGLFLVRRVFRLFPALFLCMLVLWLLSQFMNHFFAGFPYRNFEQAFRNALLIDTSAHGPSTSIQIEALATPFIIAFIFFYKKFSTLAALIFFALSLVALQRSELVFLLPNMHSSVFVFIAGMLVALPYGRVIFERITTAGLCLLIFAAFLVRHIVHIESLPGLIAQVILLAAVVGFIRWSSTRTAIHHMLESKFSQFVGKISYSYYLLNVPVLWLIWYFPGAGEYYKDMPILLAGILTGLVATVLTVPFAYFSYRYCELPLMKYGAKITAKYSGKGKLA